MKPFIILALTTWSAMAGAQTVSPAIPFDGQVPVQFSGGYDLDPRDKGRPVVLIAAALKVPPDIFREAFTHVKPAGPGHEPEPEQVRLNKQALMSALGPYGVTDERLNEVSNYYRYNRSRGETWRQVPAKAVAMMAHGIVTGITIIEPGSGYTLPPTISISGSTPQVFTAKLFFGGDLKKNGSISEIAISTPPAR